jgi:hypothetical protein
MQEPEVPTPVRIVPKQSSKAWPGAFWLPIVLSCLILQSGAQIPASFQAPVMGYGLDGTTHRLHRIVGIPGNARIEEPLDLGVAITGATVLPGQNHILVDSPDSTELLIINLENPSAPVRITGAPAMVSSIRPGGSGSSAAIFYELSRKILIVGGLADSPVVRDTIDLSFSDLPLARYAVTDDGSVALLAFSDEKQDLVYRWTRNSGARYLESDLRVEDIAFIDDHALIADAGAAQIRMFRNVRDEATPIVFADGREGLSRPVAISISKQREILVADSNTKKVIVLDLDGRVVREALCSCEPTHLLPLRDSAFRLTDRLDIASFIFESNSGKVSFIPALSPARSLP